MSKQDQHLKGYNFKTKNYLLAAQELVPGYARKVHRDKYDADIGPGTGMVELLKEEGVFNSWTTPVYKEIIGSEPEAPEGPNRYNKEFNHESEYATEAAGIDYDELKKAYKNFLKSMDDDECRLSKAVELAMDNFTTKELAFMWAKGVLEDKNDNPVAKILEAIREE